MRGFVTGGTSERAMLIGAMNHPRHDVLEEIRWMVREGLDFVDLTLEPPAAASWMIDPREVGAVIAGHGLGVVGHTAYYLPLASPVPAIRGATIEEFRRCMAAFAVIGAKWMNVHPQGHAPMHDRAFCIRQNLDALRQLIPEARQLGLGLMIENLPGDFNSVAQLSELLDPLPELGLHLDIGHANLRVHKNQTPALVHAFGHRLRHVHLHDNRGGSHDLHLGLGCGTLELEPCLTALKHSGYDATITLEVFSPDRHYLHYSKERLREIWERV